MGIAILLLGLVPLMFLPHMDTTTDEDDLQPPDDSGSEPVGDLLTNDLDAPDPDAEPSDILAPINDIDLPDDGTQPVDPEAVLGPVDQDDVLTPSDGEEGDIILPVDQIESENIDVFIDGSADAGIAYAEVEGFETGEDILHISILPEMVDGTLDVDVTQSDDGMDALIYVEQQLIAVLKDAPDASPDDIVVVVRNIGL